MRCYLVATGIVFALIFVVHGARLWAEGSWLLREPSFLLTSLAALALAIWAAVLWSRGRR